MRQRIKSGKAGSFTPEKQKVEVEQLEDREVAMEIELQEPYLGMYYRLGTYDQTLYTCQECKIEIKKA